MTKNENLLVTLSEECAEVQQAVSKALRFGLDKCNPLTPEISNEMDIMIECYQLVTVMEMLIEAGVLHELDRTDVSAIKKGKRDNVKRFQDISRDCGRIE